MTPKSLLRLPEARSPFSDMEEGKYMHAYVHIKDKYNLCMICAYSGTSLLQTPLEVS